MTIHQLPVWANNCPDTFLKPLTDLKEYVEIKFFWLHPQNGSLLEQVGLSLNYKGAYLLFLKL